MTERISTGHVPLLWALRNKLLQLLSSRWPFPSRVWTTVNENLYASHAKVFLNYCTLRTMTSLAAYVRNKVGEGNCIFVPPWETITRGSIATTEMALHLNNHRALCDVLQMRDGEDVRRLLFQTNTSGVRKVVQLIGSAGIWAGDGERALQFTRVVVGSSVCACSDTKSAYKFHESPSLVIEQPYLSWDEGLQCHASKWCLVDRTTLQRENHPYMLPAHARKADDCRSIRLKW